MPAATLCIRGDVGARTFLPWLARHAEKLGLSLSVGRHDPALVELFLSGPAELIDAMEVASLLGPIDVWVDGIEQRPSPSAGA